MIIEPGPGLSPWSADDSRSGLLFGSIGGAEGPPSPSPSLLREKDGPPALAHPQGAYAPPVLTKEASSASPSARLPESLKVQAHQQMRKQQELAGMLMTRLGPPKIDLYPKDDVPPVFWEIGILHGYRKPGSSPTECMISALVLTNETLNFWTHFLSAWYFVWQFNQFFESDLPGGHAHHDQMTWPFFAYLATICVWPMASAAAHLFNVISIEARHVCFFVDYVFLAIYCFGTALAYQAYCTNVRWWYVSVALAASYMCTGMACASRFVQSAASRKMMRVLAFFLPYLMVGWPLFRRILTDYGGEGGPLGQLAVRQHLVHIAISAGMCAVYSAHLPERWAPGKFDLIGHSHQIMHILAIWVNYVQMWAVFADMRQSLERGRSARDGCFGPAILAWFALAVLGNLTIFAYYIARLRTVLRAQARQASVLARSLTNQQRPKTTIGQRAQERAMSRNMKGMPNSILQLASREQAHGYDVMDLATGNSSDDTELARGGSRENSLTGSCLDLSGCFDDKPVSDKGAKVKFA